VGHDHKDWKLANDVSAGSSIRDGVRLQIPGRHTSTLSITKTT
jgi:hypothetical protein